MRIGEGEFLEELSVLDYLRLKLKRENWGKEILPTGEIVPHDPAATDDSAGETVPPLARFGAWVDRNFDWRPETAYPLERWSFFLAVALAFMAQLLLEPEITGPFRNGALAAILYGLAAISLILGAFLLALHERSLRSFRSLRSLAAEEADMLDETSAGIVSSDDPEVPAASEGAAARDDDPDRELRGSVPWLRSALAFAVTALAFVLFGSNRFNFLNVSVWIGAVLVSLAAFLGAPDWKRFAAGARSFLGRLNPLRLTIEPWTIACLFVFAVSGWFRFYQLSTVPTDMFSDHAEKLYDVMDVLNGQNAIFFIRNTGREAFQFYWTALMIRLFGTGVSFLSLKIGTAIAGMTVLPFVYLLGKRLSGRWVGLIVMLICGVGYWPNVLSRVALRFAFYPMFAAPVIYFLFDGLESRRKWPFALGGLLMGLGLQGYSAYRIVPFLVLVLFAIALIRDRAGARVETLRRMGLFFWFALLGALPLANIAMTSPELVWYRAFSRLDPTFSPESASAALVFVSNLWKAAIMPFWSNGRIWVHSIPYRPAFDLITAAFYFIGLGALTIRAVRKREFEVIALLISIPILLLPSALSIAFPDENPSLNRTGAAVIPMTIAAAVGLFEFWLRLIRATRSRPARMAAALAVCFLLLVGIANANRALVFTSWQRIYTNNAWNTKQIGAALRGFDGSIGDQANAFVIPYPHWVDTRLVGITGGFPERDFALPRERIGTVGGGDRPLLFVIKDDDTESEALIRTQYPEVTTRRIPGTAPGKDFKLMLVP